MRRWWALQSCAVWSIALAPAVCPPCACCCVCALSVCGRGDSRAGSAVRPALAAALLLPPSCPSSRRLRCCIIASSIRETTAVLRAGAFSRKATAARPVATDSPLCRPNCRRQTQRVHAQVARRQRGDCASETEQRGAADAPMERQRASEHALRTMSADSAPAECDLSLRRGMHDSALTAHILRRRALVVCNADTRPTRPSSMAAAAPPAAAAPAGGVSPTFSSMRAWHAKNLLVWRKDPPKPHGQVVMVRRKRWDGLRVTTERLTGLTQGLSNCECDRQSNDHARSCVTTVANRR